MRAAQAEFHVWYDAAGDKHVSTIPRQGFSPAGTIRPAYDPNSIVYQQRRMLDNLSLQADELARQRDAEIADAANSRERHAEVRAPGASREGTMNIEELIELAKLGGRFDPSASVRGDARMPAEQ
jgi:hypothetical protein